MAATPLLILVRDFTYDLALALRLALPLVLLVCCADDDDVRRRCFNDVSTFTDSLIFIFEASRYQRLN